MQGGGPPPTHGGRPQGSMGCPPQMQVGFQQGGMPLGGPPPMQGGAEVEPPSMPSRRLRERRAAEYAQAYWPPPYGQYASANQHLGPEPPRRLSARRKTIGPSSADARWRRGRAAKYAEPPLPRTPRRTGLLHTASTPRPISILGHAGRGHEFQSS